MVSHYGGTLDPHCSGSCTHVEWERERRTSTHVGQRFVPTLIFPILSEYGNISMWNG